jgi:hypothetical protein
MSFKFEELGKFEIELKNNLGYGPAAQQGRLVKKPKVKNPLKEIPIPHLLS